MATIRESRPRRWLMAPALLILLIFGLTASSAIAGTAPEDAGGKSIQPKAAGVPDAATCPIATSIIPSPNPYSNSSNVFNDIAAVSANDIWAVGAGGDRALVQHWDGSAWSIASTSNYGVLNAVTVISANDVWAVGHDGPYTLIMHWNGTQWSATSSSNGCVGDSDSFSVLNGVAGSSSNDVWAVGTCGSIHTPENAEALLLHWNGTWWTHSTLAFGDGITNLNQVTSIASNDVWAVGHYSRLDFQYIVPLALHWDGSQWTEVDVPDEGVAYLHGVDATASNDVWAVGGTGAARVGRIWHWNGTQWSSVFNFGPQGGPNITDVSASAANDVWAAAGDRALHWNGAQWSTMALSSGTSANALVALSSANVWVAGESSEQTRVEHWNGSSWTTTPSPNIVTSDHHLRAVAYIPGGPVVAAGNSYKARMIQRWTQGSWSILPPYSPAHSGTFNDVAAISNGSAWAVGYKPALYNQSYRGVVSRLSVGGWEDLEVPYSGIEETFNGVDVLSSGEVWVVGSYRPASQPAQVQALIRYWNGAEWNFVPSLSDADSSRLNKVAAISPNDIWAVGTRDNRTLIMHWNGRALSVVPSPNVGSDPNILRGIKAIASDDIWAVGSYGPPGTGQALILHWNGSEWSVVPGPAVGTDSFLFDLDAFATDDVWAVGNYLTGGVQRTLLEHWDGHAWSVVPSPNVGAEPNYMFGIVAVSHNELWAVGDYSLNGGLEHNTLTVRIDPLAFSDVSPGSTFYPYVRCLTNNGILGGYSDCTFRPNANVTRGQLSKIVANSAGFNEPVSGQVFEDVPSTNTFYEHIGRMAERGIIGGYPCGAAGEPCGSAQRPYFRPNANATRGQISKIVSRAKGYSDPAESQTFEDVPLSYNFYLDIERLASRGIMGGYPCGGAGEPCGEGNRPYFRPGNNATRGQTSKIVSNAFFPGCQPSDNP
ncbi:MAG TPA: S-layer homology domain-containing protein [Chloroflexia bacterium]|nr:S-layer homology domain-containing protein [Chloroflexia bacterium]